MQKTFTNYFIILFSPLFSCGKIAAQTIIIDSLKREISFAKTQEQKLTNIFSLCDQSFSLHPDTLLHYLTLAKNIAATKSGSKDQALLAFYESSYLLRSGKVDSAAKIVDENLLLLSKQDLTPLKFRFANTKSGVLIRANRQKESIENSLWMLNLAEQAKNTEYIIKSYNGLGWAYMELNQNAEALTWLLKAAQADSLSNFKYSNAMIYSNIAATLNELKRNDSAEYFVKKAIEMSKRTQNLYALTNSLYVYSDICLDKGNNAKAEALLHEGLQTRRQVGDPYYIISDITQMGIFYAHNKQPQKGVAIIEEGIKMAGENNFASKLPILYSALAENYKSAGDQEKYAETITRIIGLKDSLYQNNTAEELKEMEIKYDVQKTSNLNKQQKLDLVKKNYLFYGSLIFVLFAVVTSYLAFKSYRRKQKMNIELMQAAEKEMAERAVTAAEENERKRIATDLHDNLGAYANAVLYTTELLEQEDEYGERKRLMEDLKGASKDIIGSLRETIWALKKDKYTAEDCLLRISNFIQPFNRYYPHIHFKVEGDAPPKMELRYSRALNVVRIVQEAVTNAIKHSGAKNINVHSSMEGSAWKLMIIDDGKGFNHVALRGKGNGLVNMEQRAKESGFKLSIQPDVHGTSIIIII